MTVDTEILDGDDLSVAQWRVEMLTALGLDADTAEWLANGDVDWHDVERLILAGCPPLLAAEILT